MFARKPSPRLTTALVLVLIVFLFTDNSLSANADESIVDVKPNSTIVKIHRATWQQRVTHITAEPGYEWRKTDDGWQQIPFGNIPNMHRLNLPSYQPAIHPLNMTAMIVLLSLGAMAWVSDEWQWERFVGNQ